jgi:hypothetical protein
VAKLNANKSQVNLTAHETHHQSQVHAGVDVLKPPLSPMELSLMKDQRDRELRQAQEQHKQNLLLASAGARGTVAGAVSVFFEMKRLF